jgi:hypothetical protein
LPDNVTDAVLEAGPFAGSDSGIGRTQRELTDQKYATKHRDLTRKPRPPSAESARQRGMMAGGSGSMNEDLH